MRRQAIMRLRSRIRRWLYHPQVTELESRLPPGDMIGLSGSALWGLSRFGSAEPRAAVQVVLAGDSRTAVGVGKAPEVGNRRPSVAAVAAPTAAATFVSALSPRGVESVAGDLSGAGQGVFDLLGAADLDHWQRAQAPPRAPWETAVRSGAERGGDGGPGRTAPAAGAAAYSGTPIPARTGAADGNLDLVASMLTATTRLARVASAPAPVSVSGSQAAPQTADPAPAPVVVPHGDQPPGPDGSGSDGGRTGPGDDPPPPGYNTDPPPPTPPDPPQCPTGSPVQNGDGMGGNNNPSKYSDASVRYFDGVVQLAWTDLRSDGFGAVCDQRRSWSNGEYNALEGNLRPRSDNGRGMVAEQLPYLTGHGSHGGDLYVITSSTSALIYDWVGPNLVPRYYNQDQLTFTNGEFVLTDTAGNQTHFYDTAISGFDARWGKFKSMTDPYGNVTTVTSWTADGRQAEVQRRTPAEQSPQVVESWVYSYVPSGANQGSLQNVTLRRQVDGGAWNVVRQVAYTYYDTGEANGNPTDLKTATVEDAAGHALDTSYYRYYARAGSGTSAFDGLKYAFNPQSYARLVAAVGNPLTATDAKVQPYADDYFEYDAQRRVSKAVVQGAGCSCAADGGQGIFTYNYSASPFGANYNTWKNKTVETLPDNSSTFVSRNIVYTNIFGEVMLKVYESGAPSHTQQWDTFYKYDDAGRVVLQANPSAVTGYDENSPDLLRNVNGHYQFLRDNQGEIVLTDYAATTTATATTSGSVAGYYADTKLQQGQLGTPILQASQQYLARTGGTFDVQVVAGGPSVPSAADRFSYVDVPPPIPAVTGLGVTRGSVLGGQAVPISGSGFTGASEVDFDGTATGDFTVISDTSILAHAPSHAAGAVDVRVKGPGGTSAVTAADQFTFVAPPAPVLTGLGPINSGTIFGGITLTLSGTNLSGASRVIFGTTPAAFTVRSDNAITVQVPARAPGLVDVRVTTPGGTTAPTAVDHFTYRNPAAPTVTGLSLTSGSVVGGDLVTIRGTGFTGAMDVRFGSSRTSFTVNSDNSVTARVPARAAATMVDVTVATPGGTSALTAVDQFNYVLPPAPVVIGLTPPNGLVSGGTSVTIVGSNLSGATAVRFGAMPALSFTVDAPTKITARAPAEAAGMVDVTVTTPGGTSAISAGDQFTYVTSLVSDPPQPVVAGLSPATGGTAGGTVVTIVGTGFRGTRTVTFGGVRATSVNVVSPDIITAQAPALPAGPVDVQVTNLDGTSGLTAADQFTAVAPAVPMVTGLSQTTGNIFGGGVVTVFGSGLSGATRVTVGGTPATSVKVLSDTAVSFRLPGHASGMADVTVTTPGGTSAVTAADVYTYSLPAAPVVTGLSPSRGSIVGGATLVIAGTGFTGATAVAFGSVPAARFTVVSDTAISVVVPAQAMGTIDVTVTTPGGTSTAVPADQFTYALPPMPTVTLVTPASGSAVGGTNVIILGSGLSGATEVDFGGMAAASITMKSDGEIVAQAPPGTAGMVDITVTTPGGTSATSAADQFTYVSPPVPVVTGLSQASGPSQGGDTITLIGSGFMGTSAITFGDTPAPAVTVISDHAVSARIPAHDPGMVDITVTTPGGTSDIVAADQYTYVTPAVPVVTGVGPTEGLSTGGGTITILGSGFTGATAVAFGAVPAAAVTVLSDSALLVPLPAHDPGMVDVTVTGPGGTSDTTTADQLTYVTHLGTHGPKPVVTGVGPATGGTLGGTLVTIIGTGFTGATTVKFGTGVASTVAVLSDSALIARTPANVAGNVEVTVTTPGGTSDLTPADRFTYTLQGPVVTGLSVTSGPSAGGYVITVIGSGFTGATTVTFGGAPAANFQVLSEHALNVTVPPHPLDTFYPIASQTIYRNPDGTGAETTQYAFTWYPGTARIQSVTATKPTISGTQNGPGTPDVETSVYDIYGREIWHKDGDGFINYTEYDQGTGAVTKTIVDVDTTRTTDFQNLPAGWVTPPGGGLHLETQMGVDSLGREIQRIDPNGNIAYTVYDDPNHEVRVYPGWNPDTNMPTGPTQVTREDRSHTPSYVEKLTMSAPPHVDANGQPDGTEPISGIQSLTRTFTSPAAQTIERDAYVSLDGIAYATDPYLGRAGTNYYVTTYDYDDHGRLNRVGLPTGTINRTVYDGLGRVISTWVGTSDTTHDGEEWTPDDNGSPSNMVQLTADVYDNGGVGDGNLTQMTQFPGGGTAARVTQNYYDWRDRLVASKQGVQASENDGTHRPITYMQYDNRNEVVSQERYDGDGVTITSTNGVPDRPAANLLRAKMTTAYDDQGRVYRSDTYSVDPSNGTVSSSSLMTGIWYNHRGQVIKTVQPGETMTAPGTCCGNVGPTGTSLGCSSGCQAAAAAAMSSASALGLATKNQYDGAGRLIASFVTDGLGDTSWADAGTVVNNNVLSQTETQYDGDGNTIFVTQRQRFHDETRHGALGDPSSTDQAKARASYMASYYDAANRLTDQVDVGTNGGTPYDRPDSPPAGSDTIHVTHMDYDAAGRVAAITDPRGLVTETTYDLLNRTVQTVAAYSGDGTPTDNTNQTTAYTYDGDNHILTQTAVLPGGVTQTTRYVYGIAAPIHSNDMMASVIYPENGQNATETYGYNALGQMVSKTDRNLTTHTDSYDVLGRQTTDAITTLGSGVDGQVQRLETAYNSQGLAYLFTSYDAASGGHVVNQVEQVFNGLRQLVTEYQAHAGPVDTAATPKVQYAYSEMANGVNHSRLVSMTYPDGTVLRYNYGAGVDDAISRLTALSDSTGVLEAYRYLGLTTVVIRSHPQPGVDLTYVKQAGEPDGDAGDPYTGLDRFGRVVDQRWLSTSDGSATDRFQYGYDPNGNRLYRDNLVNAAFGELYQASGTDAGYDPLNRLTDFARGTLNDAHDALVGTPSTSESWSLDALGNWVSVTSDGTTQSRDHNAQNQITAINGNPLAYDNNGNLTTDDAGQAYSYDAWNRLVAVQDPSGSPLASYAYDALGRRMIENSGTAVDLYFSKDWQVLEERVGAAVQAHYVWSSVYVDALVLRDRGSERLYVQQDANWDVTALVDVSGTVQERYIYDPYGQFTVLTPDWAVRGTSIYGWIYLHQGGRYDSASGLYDFRHREYSATLGRWMQEDPLGNRAGMDLYEYVRSNPLIYVDWRGLDEPGCDLPKCVKKPPVIGDCQLRCCAQHDKCYYDNHCHASSWLLSPPIIGKCWRCNFTVARCFLSCATGGHGPNNDPWFCPNGPNKGKFYPTFAEVPPDCWSGFGTDHGKKKPASPYG